MRYRKSSLPHRLSRKRVSDRVEALESLAKINDPAVVKEVIGALSDRSPAVRAVAVEWLSALRTKEATVPLLGRLEDSNSEVRMMATSALGDLLRRKSPPALIRKLQDPDELVRIEAAESLGAIGDKNALTALWNALADRSSLVRSYVAAAIGELGSRKDIVKLEDRLRKEKSETARVGYYQALHKLGKRDVLDDLLRMLSDRKDYRLRCAVAKILCDIVDENSARSIYTALNASLRREPTEAARSSIRSGIREIKKRFPHHFVRTRLNDHQVLTKRETRNDNCC